MATKQLLQILLKSREGIQSGAIKVKDIVTEYLTSTGAKTISPDERYTINKEFSELAPSNVIGDVFGDFQGLQKDAGDVMPTGGMPTGGMFTGKINYPAMQKHLGVTLRGNETFDELLEIEKAIKLKNKAKTGMSEFDEILDAEFKKAFGKKESKQGLGSLYPKGGMSEEIKRDDLAGFMKAMRAAGIKNEDVMDVAKIKDVAEGKRAATTLARAADMGADTKIKQEFLSDLDEKVMNNGPRYFQEEFQGYDSYGELIQNESIRIRNAIVDDLEELGVDDQKVTRIIRYANDVAKKNPYQPEAFIDAIKQDIELEGIKYDMSFWENYISKILELSAKAEPRFAGGGLV
jgi:hypothetical protein